MVASPGGVCAAANAERQLKDMYSIVASNLHISTGEAKQVVNETLGSTDENNFIVRTRADDYPIFSDERYAATDSCGAQIVTTDYPPRTVREEQHTFTFNGYMFKLLK